MIKIEIELENGDRIVKDNLTHAMGNVSVQLRGDCRVLANELGIALYEIFLQSPKTVTDAIDYMSRHIDDYISKEEE